MVNVRAANNLARRSGLTGVTRQQSLTLSNPDSTKPASWVKGLTVALETAVLQINFNFEPITLFLWIFIPDGQAFFFVDECTCNFAPKALQNPIYVKYSTMDNEHSRARDILEKLVPRGILELALERNKMLSPTDKSVNVAAVYVYHNRDAEPLVKSQYETLNLPKIGIHQAWDLWWLMWKYPWLRNYIHFNSKTTKEMLNVFGRDMQPYLYKFDLVKHRNTMLELKSWMEERMKG